jgi:hypothetical protein
MNRSEKNNAICIFWLKFTSLMAKRIMKWRAEDYKKGSTSIKINEANHPFGEIWKIPEEIFLEPAHLCWMDGRLGAWRMPSRLAFF